MRKRALALMAVLLSGMMSISSYAGEWKQDNAGWWYQNDDGSYPTNSWQEIDGKQYYFGSDGYMLHDTTTPDGYKVGSDGAWIEENAPSESSAETINIDIPVPTGYGSVKGNVTWQYNKFIGTKADTGAKVFLIPLDYNIKGGDNHDLAYAIDPEGHNGVYCAKVDGFGQYTIDKIPAGNYRLVTISRNTTGGYRFQDKKGWEKMIKNIMGDFLTTSELKTFKTMVGYNNIVYTDVSIEDGQTLTHSFDFGYTYI